MKREIITITDEGTITVPENPGRVRMSVGEIAVLLGLYYPTAKRHVRAIEKAGIGDGDYSMTCVAEGTTAHPMFYGLEMIAAVSFRVGSWQAGKLRRWLMVRAAQIGPKSQTPIAVLFPVKEKTLPN